MVWRSHAIALSQVLEVSMRTDSLAFQTASIIFAYYVFCFALAPIAASDLAAIGAISAELADTLFTAFLYGVTAATSYVTYLLRLRYHPGRLSAAMVAFLPALPIAVVFGDAFVLLSVVVGGLLAEARLRFRPRRHSSPC